VNNNPVRYNDPTGHKVEDDEGVERCEDPSAENNGSLGQCKYRKPPICTLPICRDVRPEPPPVAYYQRDGSGPSIYAHLNGFFLDDGVIGGRGTSLRYQAGYHIDEVGNGQTVITLTEQYNFTGTTPENDYDSGAGSQLYVTSFEGEKSQIYLGAFDITITGDTIERVSTFKLSFIPNSVRVKLALYLDPAPNMYIWGGSPTWIGYYDF
jgi:hypothetical protein